MGCCSFRGAPCFFTFNPLIHGSRPQFSNTPPGHHRIQKTRTLLLSEKSSDFVVVVHLQGLEPWAHWLRETNVQQSSIFRITQIRYFYRFTVNLRFASAAFFAPVILSCIRYPAVPVCKKCAKMCRAKINPLKQYRIFMQSRETGRVRAQNSSWNLACLDQASNVHSQLWFMAGIWTIEQTSP